MLNYLLNNYFHCRRCHTNSATIKRRVMMSIAFLSDNNWSRLADFQRMLAIEVYFFAKSNWNGCGSRDIASTSGPITARSSLILEELLVAGYDKHRPHIYQTWPTIEVVSVQLRPELTVDNRQWTITSHNLMKLSSVTNATDINAVNCLSEHWRVVENPVKLLNTRGCLRSLPTESRPVEGKTDVVTGQTEFVGSNLPLNIVHSWYQKIMFGLVMIFQNNSIFLPNEHLGR